MPFAIWESAWSVGVRTIDNQHQLLCDAVNRLHEAVTDGRGYLVITSILAELLECTQSHFTTEEAYFDHYHYPGAEAHKRKHQAFLKRLYRLHADSNNPAVALETLRVLMDWFHEHIKTEDRHYAEYIRHAHTTHSFSTQRT